VSNLLVDERDQRFVLHEMLNVQELCKTPLYNHLSKDTFDMSLDAARELAVKEVYPTLMEAEKEGCRFENGQVTVPRCFQRLKEHFIRGGWPSVDSRKENGGQGFPMTVWLSVYEWFQHNNAFFFSMNKPFSATNFIEQNGTEEQKEKYLRKMVAGKWGPVLAVNEDNSGSDFTMQTTTAIKQSDGTYRIRGTKHPVSTGDSDLFENIVHVVLARIEGDPLGEYGLSVFLVPKYLVNEDGSLGPRNDYSVGGIEDKLGMNGNPTCLVNYGDNDNCYAELLGEERKGTLMALRFLNNGRLCCGLTALGIASAAYLHALEYAKKRKQGASIMETQDPEAPRVAIIEHPDVRRMLLWMKSHVEGMRALTYFSGYCVDKGKALTETDEKEMWSGLAELLVPICRIYCADMGFKVAETAIQVHGRYGYFKGYPVEQFVRDIKPISIWEMANGVHALVFVAQTMTQRQGMDFANLLSKMNTTIARYNEVEGIQDLAVDVQFRVTLLGEMGMFFLKCAKEDKTLVPISNATPFAHLVGNVCLGWLLFWEAGIAAKNLEMVLKENHIDPKNATQRSELLSKNKDAAFYDGKILAARYYIKNILPQTDYLATAIKSEDLSVMAIDNESF
jgi:alkylation response protein AidB-like acyl-CoA dehydrogenase